MTEMKIYDIATDSFRPVTQEDISNFTATEQAYGALIRLLREVSKPRPDTSLKDRLHYLRKVEAAARV